jgi:hypothetical protein
MRLTLSVLPRASGEGAAPEDGVPFDAPLRHMGSLFVVAQGGSTPYLFSGGGVHPFEARADSSLVLPIPNAVAIWAAGERPRGTADEEWRSAFAAEIAVFGASYEDVVLLGAPHAVVDTLIRRGYVVDRDRAGVFVGRFAPCNASLHLELSERRPVRVRFGVPPLPQALWQFELPPPERTPASIDVPIAPRSCGAAWIALEPVKDDRAGGSVRCQGAGSDGRLSVDIGKTTRAVRCAVEWGH